MKTLPFIFAVALAAALMAHAGARAQAETAPPLAVAATEAPARPLSDAARPLTDAAQRMYEDHGGAVYQVQVIDRASNKKAAIGSGFQLDAAGLMATNYHVVSDVIAKPAQNRLEYLHENGTRGSLAVLAVDVVNDLALLRMDKPGTRFVTPGTSDLRKGTRVFALGNPHDIGFSIVEGTHNGRAAETFHEKIHFSGAINQGMSGGPALSADGRVVGVNVMTGGNQIGFLVPVEALVRLIKKQAAQGQGDFLARAHDDIETQLVESGAAIMQEILGPAGAPKDWDMMAFGPLMLPGRLHPALKCWGAPAHADKDPYTHFWSMCYNEDSVFLSDSFETGVFFYRYDLIKARDGLWQPRFNSFYEGLYSGSAEASNGGEGDVSNFACHDSFVDQAGRRFKASFCLRQYKKYDRLYDAHLYLAMVDGGAEGLMVTVNALGVTRDHALLFMERFLSSIRPRQLAAADATTETGKEATP